MVNVGIASDMGMQPFLGVGKKEGQGRCIINYGMVEQIRDTTALFWPDPLVLRAIEEGLLELEKDKCERARAGEHGNQETWVTDGRRTDKQTNQNSNHLLAAGMST